MVNSVVLWLQVLSDSSESPSGSLEVYRQTNWVTSPCCSQWQKNPNLWSEVQIQKNLDTRSVNVLLEQPVTWEKSLTPFGCKENITKGYQVEKSVLKINYTNCFSYRRARCPEHRRYSWIQQTFVKLLPRSRCSARHLEYMYTYVYVYPVCICMS